MSFGVILMSLMSLGVRLLTWCVGLEQEFGDELDEFFCVCVWGGGGAF